MTNEIMVQLIQKGINEKENLENLYKANEGYIRMIAKKYKDLVDIEDLMQEGYFGLYDAVQRYEGDREAKFMTYAAFWIKRSMIMYIERDRNKVRIPQYIKELKAKYNKVVNAFESQLGRRPSDEELCSYLNIDFKALKILRGAIYQFNDIESLDKPYSKEDDSYSVEDTLDSGIDIENNVVDNMMDSSLQNDLWNIVKDNTTEDENRVINHRYRGNMTLEQTGNAMGMTRDRARTIEGKALRKLRSVKVRRLLDEKYEVNYAKGYNGRFSSWKYSGESIVEHIMIRNFEITGIYK